MTKELVAHIVRQLVSHPEKVSVSIVKSGERNLIEIAVHESDRGKVIGREGQTIKAIRMLVNAVVSDNKRVAVDVAKSDV